MNYDLLPALILLAAPALPAAPADPVLDAGYKQMYNLEFSEAHKTFATWKQAHPHDPLGPVSDAAAYLFAEFDRLRILQSEFFTHDENFTKPKQVSSDATARIAFDRELNNGEKLAKSALNRSPQDANALFASILALGLRSDYDALIEKRYLRSLTAMKTSRLAAEKLLAMDPTYYDAYMAMGVENYMLSLKAAPVRWVLRMSGAATDREEGLRKLHITAEQGHYLQPFARLLLAVAALRDKDVNKARGLLQGLSQQFPRNRLFSEELARLH